MNCYANVIMYVLCVDSLASSSLSEHCLLIILLCFGLGCWYYIWFINSFLAQQQTDHANIYQVICEPAPI